MFRQSEIYNEIKTDTTEGKNVSVFGVGRNTRRAVFSMLDRAVLIEPDYVSAREAFDLISALDSSAVFLPSRSDSVGLYAKRFGDNDYERLNALSRIATAEAVHVVTFVEAALQLYPRPADVAKAALRLCKEQELDPTVAAKKLASAGYKRVPQISGRGEFSLRGDILDIYSVDGLSCRIYFDFDIIGDIKILDGDQLPSHAVPYAELPPCGEAYYDESEIPAIVAELYGGLKNLPRDAADKLAEAVADLEFQMQCGARDLPAILPCTASASFAEFFDGFAAVIADAKQCADNADLHLREHNSRVTALLQSGDALPQSSRQMLPPGEAFAFAGGSLTFHTGMSQNRLFKSDKLIELTDFAIPNFANDYNYLEQFVRGKLKEGYEFYIHCGTASAADALKNFFESRFLQTGKAAGVNIVSDYLPVSFALTASRQIYLGTPTVVYRAERKGRSRREIMPLPEVGDYVVHSFHGIGKCLSIEKLNLTGAERDYVIIGYDGGDKLMLPVENLDSLSKFSYDGTEPRLSRLGGGQFARMKEKVKSSIKEMAIDLVALYGKRESGQGHVYADESQVMDEFISAFEYTDTPDQSESTAEILNDLALGKIMDRLLCGDVGFGKTEVSMRAAYRVIIEGKQVALLCPTTILAYQHYKTVRRRMEPFGVRVGMLSRLSTTAEAAATLERLESGELDIVCGTHRLLGKDVKFRDLGLLVLDEEQRFGVSHKEQLKELKTSVNVLAMTATPIPRTLHMSLSGIRDISMLTTPPQTRLPVQTFVTEYSDGMLYDALMRERSRDGQSFIVYNRVESIAKFAANVNRICDGKLKIGVMHGQMASRAAEDEIEKFASGDTDVLIATTIIENGIDIPRANTMIVVDSDRFGLSQMYQLRGRIGRSDKLANAYFTYAKENCLSETAVKRLDAIMQCKELGSGFMLAMRDLEIRGAGNILGRQQHGHMEQVGYDMYMKLLLEVVGELRGEKPEEREEVRVRTDVAAFIPCDYITDSEWRVRQYSRISRVGSLVALKKIESDLSDMYGKPPMPVTNLLAVALVKNIAQSLGACEAALMRGEGLISFRKAMNVPSDFAAAAERGGGKLVIRDKAIILFPSGKAMLKFLINTPPFST